MCSTLYCVQTKHHHPITLEALMPGASISRKGDFTSSHTPTVVPLTNTNHITIRVSEFCYYTGHITQWLAASPPVHVSQKK